MKTFRILASFFIATTVLFCFSTLSAQPSEVTRVAHTQLGKPAVREIRAAFYKADTSARCGLQYGSIKFVVHPTNLVCDTVIFSKDFAPLNLNSTVFKNFEVNWNTLIDTVQYNQKKPYEIILPFSLYMYQCEKKYSTLSDERMWEVFCELVMLDKKDKANIIFLRPTGISSAR